jgi:hypothetical protein
MDIGWDWLEEKVGKSVFEALKDGDDITSAFEGDIACPVKVIVLEVEGPGGGNPFVELHFMDEDHSWEWYKENMSQGDAEIDIEEYELARDIAA